MAPGEAGRQTREARAEMARGHQSLTPNRLQPAPISQKSSGGLWW